ncbi:YmdB family metallophosphoesterase [Pseudonocardia sp. C8]|uniref:YmdB family metallophosphoesterase n=1 Tax=Pseudonocardia sp. C8 TaxID=2762759 RepID=UPI001C92BF71|nr:YmdB family metallophosphoesterase [Pseudonocardia sp. C8]
MSPAGHRTAPMTVLAVGDVVGSDAAGWLADRLPRLREEHEADFVVVNAENCAVTGPIPMDGFGMTVEVIDRLLDAGVDAITGGNHSWDGPDVDDVLAYPQVVRPVNLDETRGRGLITLTRGDRTLTVINLLSPTAALPGMKAPQPEPLWPSWTALAAAEDLPGAILIDLHGESPWEKASLAAALDGQVSALVGTHTHDPTLRGHLLPAGTAYVAELGMTGPLGFTGGGFDPAHFAARLRGEDHTALPPYELATGPMSLGAVRVDIGADGSATAIDRIT